MAITWAIFSVTLNVALVGNLEISVAGLAPPGAGSAAAGLAFGVVYYGILWGFLGLWVLGARSRMVDVLWVVGRAFVWPGVIGIAWAIALPLFYDSLGRGPGVVAQLYTGVGLLAGIAIWAWAVIRATKGLRRLGELAAGRTAALVGWLLVPGLIAFMLTVLGVNVF
jgi:hypothetical protein